MKILVIIALAKYYSELDQEYLGFRELLIGGSIVFVLPYWLVVTGRSRSRAVTYFRSIAVLSFWPGEAKAHHVAAYGAALQSRAGTGS